MVGLIPEEPSERLTMWEAFVGELDAYLADDALFRLVLVQLPGRTLHPNMTLGLALDTRHLLDEDLEHLAGDERARLAAADDAWERTRLASADGFAAKLRQEIKNHLDSWAWYLGSCEHGDEDCSDTYPSEVWIRTRLKDLLVEARAADLDIRAEYARLSEMDERLNALLVPGAYVGPAGQQEALPRSEYWWLYGRPAPRD